MATLAGPALHDAPIVAPVLGRVAAVATLASAVVHVLMVDVAALGSLALLGMALACLPCARHLWRRPTGRVWGLTATLDGTMLVLHVQGHAAQAAVGTSHVGHVDAGHGADGLMWLGMGLLAGQLAVAGLACLSSLRARRAR